VPAQQQQFARPVANMPQGHEFTDEMVDNDIIGVIKIKDGLFICDELGAQVSCHYHF
jgi:hypothetical protein